MATNLNNLGKAWNALGESQKAIGFYEQALVIFTEVLGPVIPAPKPSLTIYSKPRKRLENDGMRDYVL